MLRYLSVCVLLVQLCAGATDPSCVGVPISVSNISSCTGNTCYAEQRASLSIPALDGSKSCASYTSPFNVSSTQNIRIRLDNSDFRIVADSCYGTGDPGIRTRSECGCTLGSSANCAGGTSPPQPSDYYVCIEGPAGGPGLGCIATTWASFIGFTFDYSFIVCQMREDYVQSASFTVDDGTFAKFNFTGYQKKVDVSSKTNVIVTSTTVKPSIKPEFIVYPLNGAPEDFYFMSSSQVNGINEYDPFKIGWNKVGIPGYTKTTPTFVDDVSIKSNYHVSLIHCTNPEQFKEEWHLQGVRDMLRDNPTRKASAMYPGAKFYGPGRSTSIHLATNGWSEDRDLDDMLELANPVDFYVQVNNDSRLFLTNDVAIMNSQLGVLNYSKEAWRVPTFPNYLYIPGFFVCADGSWHAVNVETQSPTTGPRVGLGPVARFKNGHVGLFQWTDGKGSFCVGYGFNPINSGQWFTEDWDTDYGPVGPMDRIVHKHGGKLTYTDPYVSVDEGLTYITPMGVSVASTSLPDEVLVLPTTTGDFNVLVNTQVPLSFEIANIKPTITKVVMAGHEGVVTAKSTPVGTKCILGSEPPEVIHAQAIILYSVSSDFKFEAAPSKYNGTFNVIISCGLQSDSKATFTEYNLVPSASNDTVHIVDEPNYGLGLKLGEGIKRFLTGAWEHPWVSWLIYGVVGFIILCLLVWLGPYLFQLIVMPMFYLPKKLFNIGFRVFKKVTPTPYSPRTGDGRKKRQ